MREAVLGPMRIPFGDPAPFVGLWLRSNGGSVYRVLWVREMNRWDGETRSYRLGVECHGHCSMASLPKGAAVYSFRWDKRKGRTTGRGRRGA